MTGKRRIDAVEDPTSRNPNEGAELTEERGWDRDGFPRVAGNLPSGRPLRVCLASPLFFPEYSGGATRFRGYAPGLANRGIRMDVLAAEVGRWKRNRRYAASDVGPGEGQEETALEVTRVPMPTSRLPGRAERWRTRWNYESALLSRCRDATTSPDALIWRYPPTLSALRVLHPLRSMGIPMMRVVTMFDRPLDRGWRGWVRPLTRPVPYRYLNSVVVGSSVMRDNLRRLGVEAPIDVIPHGVDLNRFRFRGEPGAVTRSRSKLRIDPSIEVVLFVGPIVERKGVDLLVKAWDHIATHRPKAHLMLVGPEKARRADGNSFPDRLRGILARGHGGDRVTFTGHVANVEDYYQAADVFVFPSWKEGMPNVVCEALASGLPCVLTPFLGLPEEFGTPGREYVLVDHDPAPLAQAVVHLLADGEDRRRFARAARQWTEQHLDLEQTLDLYAGLLRRLVHESSRS